MHPISVLEFTKNEVDGGSRHTNPIAALPSSTYLFDEEMVGKIGTTTRVQRDRRHQRAIVDHVEKRVSIAAGEESNTNIYITARDKALKKRRVEKRGGAAAAATAVFTVLTGRGGIAVTVSQSSALPTFRLYIPFHQRYFYLYF